VTWAELVAWAELLTAWEELTLVLEAEEEILVLEAFADEELTLVLLDTLLEVLDMEAEEDELETDFLVKVLKEPIFQN
jgi:hypothetical protein